MDWTPIIDNLPLIISVTGSVAGPLITTILTNRHQSYLRKLDIEHQTIKDYNEYRQRLINSFLSNSSACLACTEMDSLEAFGSSYHSVYQFVPPSFWPELDEFFNLVTQFKIPEARDKYPLISHTLSEILKETPSIVNTTVTLPEATKPVMKQNN